MPKRSWSSVDSQVRPSDVLSFLVVGAYLLLVWAYLVATRQIRPGLSVRGIARQVVAFPRRVGRGVFRWVRPRDDARQRNAA